MSTFKVQHIGKLRLGAQHFRQSLREARASGRHAPHVRLKLGLDFNKQRVCLNKARIAKGNEDAARA
ncbi:MAG TPA: hypothetical protein VHZ07_04240 [Bryobacteraceae bacterium]|nr:hypothetical protein [Bryobacteraceae bacterium]